MMDRTDWIIATAYGAIYILIAFVFHLSFIYLIPFTLGGIVLGYSVARIRDKSS